MTACVSVVDVLALAPDPLVMSANRLRQRFGIGHERASVILDLARKAHRELVEHIISTCGVNRHEAVTWLWMLRHA